MTEIRPAPRAMKKAIDFCRPATTMYPAYAGGGSGSFSLGQAVFNRGDFDGFGEAKPLQHGDLNPGAIEFVPGKAVTGRGGMSMVVVVPAFSGGQKGNPPVVAGVIARGKTALAPHMCRGIHEPGSVQADHDAQAGPPEEHREATDGIKDSAQNHQRHPVVVVQPDIERILGQVWRVFGHETSVVVLRFAKKQPSDVSPPGAVARGVGVTLLV